MAKIDYDKEVNEGIDEVERNTDSINKWTIVNTIFTIITGTATAIIAIIQFLGGK